MNPRLIKRLDLLASVTETRLRGNVTRLNASLADLTAQRATLATYQSRLTAGWTSGAAIPTAAAQRAEIFCAAARTADAQITARAAQLQSQRDTALQNLADIKQRRKKLHDFTTAPSRR